MKISAIIPARGGSKRLEKKNIFPVAGKPMLSYAVKACENSKYDISVFVSTDCSEIAEVASNLGVNVHNRSKENSGNKVYKQVAIREAALYIDSAFGPQDIYISLQANSPTITENEIDNCIDALLKYNRDEIISRFHPGIKR